ncbi:hypothetical protein AAFP30_14485 [Gordonia sp. CPCC 205515]|uniref:hypothetical protein n=1 Tax=Gordonia sp. CPCC 205515 TaxID=3140791 RepID=UPI003AF3499D
MRTAVMIVVAMFGLLLAGCGTDQTTVAPSTVTVQVTATATPSTTPSTARPPTQPAAVPGARGDNSHYSMQPAGNFIDQSVSGRYRFSLPSGNITCIVSTSSLVCQTHQPVPIAQSETCRIPDYQPYETTNAKNFGWLDYDKPACGTILQGRYFEVGPVLEYGQAVSFEPRSNLQIICYSRSAGVACENPAGYGFSLAREGFEFYPV